MYLNNCLPYCEFIIIIIYNYKFNFKNLIHKMDDDSYLIKLHTNYFFLNKFELILVLKMF